MGYALGVRSSMMIAHSFTGEEFGPAQQTHGATYIVDCEFRCESLVPKLNWVVNIADAQALLEEVLSQYKYKDLDKVEALRGENTTTEFMCYRIFSDIKARVSANKPATDGNPVLVVPEGCELQVKLGESHVAWASYTGKLY